MMFNACPQEFIDLANDLADTAGPIARLYFRSDIEIDRKSDASPVTIADREVESAMRDLITERFPDHGIFGEEHGSENLDAEFVWVLDPIDGTGAFVTGMPIFGTLIALLHRDQPLLGIIDMPVLRERCAVPGRRRPCQKPAFILSPPTVLIVLISAGLTVCGKLPVLSAMAVIAIPMVCWPADMWMW